MNTKEKTGLSAEWKRRVIALKGATYLTLDDAIVHLAHRLMEDLQISSEHTDAKRAILMHMYKNEGLLAFVISTLDIREE